MFQLDCGGRSGLPHPQLTGTLVKFCRDKSRGEEEEEEFSQGLGPVLFFLNTEQLQKHPLVHLEHPECSSTLKLEKSTASIPFHTTACKNLTHLERTAIKDHLLVCCTPSPTDPLKLPLGTHNVTAKKYKVSLSTVKRIWYQYKDSASKNKDGVGEVANNRRNNCGRKRKATVLDSLEEMKKLPKNTKSLREDYQVLLGLVNQPSLEGSSQQASKR